MVKRRLLITGSAGFIGSSLRKMIDETKFEVIGLDKVASNPGDLSLDLRDNRIIDFIASYRPEVIIHLAAQIDVSKSFEDPEEDLMVNSLGTLRLIKSGITSGCKNFIYIASGGAVYGAPENLPSLESERDSPLSPYGISKNVGEQYLRVLASRTEMQWTSLALSNCYGNFESHRRGVIYEFWKSLTKGTNPVIYGPDNTRDFVNVDDVISAILLSISCPTNQRVNISSNTETSLMELFLKMKNLTKSNVDPILMPAKNGDVARSCLDNKLARQLLGWQPTIALDEGLSSILNKSRISG